MDASFACTNMVMQAYENENLDVPPQVPTKSGRCKEMRPQSRGGHGPPTIVLQQMAMSVPYTRLVAERRLFEE